MMNTFTVPADNSIPQLVPLLTNPASKLELPHFQMIPLLDDTQLYIGTNSSMLTTQIALIESCTQRVHNWLLNNGLHLNPSKSEAIVFYNPRFKPLAALAESIGTVSIAGSPIKLQTSIKNLGVSLDSKMSFDKQVSETCKACYFHIRTLRHIRTSLSTELQQ